MIDAESVVNLYHSRRKTHAPRLARMEELRRAYLGELEIPLPELDRTEKPMVANLIAQGLDGTAQRISSTLPNVSCPALRPGFNNAEGAAETKRNVIYGWWSMNKLSRIQRRRARWLVGYSSAPVMIRPDPVRSIPKWQERNPMTALPPPGDDLDPVNCFTGDTEFITKEFGVVPLAEMVGQTVTVLTRDGWAKGDVGHFGRREVQQVTFAPASVCRGGKTYSTARSNHRVVITVTPDHRWPLVDGSVTTTLAVGDTVHAVASQETEDHAMYEEGLRHGLIFGDGSVGWTYSNGDREHRVRLCGAKARFTEHFERVTYPPSCDEEPVCWLRRAHNLKDLPAGQSVDYLRGFVDGWAATDGCDLGNGTVRISSQHPSAGEWLVRFAALAGWVVRGWSIRPTSETPYGTPAAPLNNISLVRQDRAAGWKVVAIETLSEPEDLYCAVVPGPEMFALASGVYTGNCIFSFKKSLGWLRRIYPDSIAGLNLGGPAGEVSPDTEFTIVEYADHDVICQIVLGAAPDESSRSTWSQPPPAPRPGRPWVEIEWQPNLAGICPVVNPTRVSLDDPVGQYDGLIGLYWWQSKMMALGGIAAQRDVFPDEWEVERPNEALQIEVEADGLAGIRGRIKGGQIESIHATPGQQTMAMLNVMERNIRLTGGIPAEMTGEAASNIRTARRGAQVLSSAIDFTIQEAQETFEASLEEENIRAIAIDKAYFGGQSKSFYFSWNNRKGRGSYTPSVLWDSDENDVKFSFPGADINDLVVGAGQRLGMETMSHHRFMELDPLIEDPELEKQRVTSENLERGTLQALMQGISSGQIPPADAARISQLVLEKKKPLWEAIQIAQKEAQQRQASSGPPGTPEGPVAPGAPEAQPGLGPPGVGAEAGTAIQGPSQSSQNLQQLLSNLRRPLAGVGGSPAGG